jgi:hypothetical protein
VHVTPVGVEQGLKWRQAHHPLNAARPRNVRRTDEFQGLV